MRRNIFIIMFVLLLSYALFELVLKNKTIEIYCILKTNVKIKNFRDAAFRLGVVDINEEENYIKKISRKLIEDCISSQKNEK